ncbi:ATP-binding cassette domain-containing protein [Salisediminibacterium beveridgei]|uniref:Spermidine/putrescine import ATP-binding protein PotA n=1 Tax=Salisediminibacterium beveridgei TaxID=632773 RepID=A0A1D7QXZ5_9BACI|nr:ATP-binding cassette domain-containing protein [Salisediminibacterium beveridgei]AOM83838.1 Spermidine/putrescine import ATP-binding protein PotA [Salisediminibacterium beveridgei]
MNNPIVSYRNVLCKRGSQEIIRLDRLDLLAGDRLGIMGPNGAGKSTLLKALAMLEAPDAGEVMFEGQKVNLEDPPLKVRRRLASVFQHSQRFQTSVFENVAIGLKLRKVPQVEIKERVKKWLAVFRIDHLADAQAYALSGGEAQRMNLARAFVLEPDVLFLDEPFSALDFPTKMTLITELDLILKNTSTTAVLISHDLTEITQLTNRLLYLKDGINCDQGNTSSLLHEPSEKLAAFLQPWREHPLFKIEK